MAKTLEAINAAAALGVDVNSKFSTQQWVPDTHPHLSIDRLVTEDGVCIPYRIQDFIQGTVVTKVAADKDLALGSNPTALRALDRYISTFGRVPAGIKVDPNTVDTTHAEVMDIQVTKNLKFMKDLEEKFPGEDFSAIQFTVQNGKLKADLSALPAGRQNSARGLVIAASYADKIILG